MPGKKFLPVIHVLNMDQMLRNLEIAKSNGADGVFLINHGPLRWTRLLTLHVKAVELYPDLWIGINFLDLPTHEVFQHVPESLHGIWADDGGIHEKSITYAKKIVRHRKESSFTGAYFGGVAFKGQGYVQDVKKVARVATDFMDIVTTSGDGTGQAASIDKIVSMKEAIGDRSLALASGVTIDNVGVYLPHVDYFLVATGICSSFHELDPVKVKNLSKVIHEF